MPTDLSLTSSFILCRSFRSGYETPRDRPQVGYPGQDGTLSGTPSPTPIHALLACTGLVGISRFLAYFPNPPSPPWHALHTLSSCTSVNPPVDLELAPPSPAKEESSRIAGTWCVAIFWLDTAAHAHRSLSYLIIYSLPLFQVGV